MAASPFRIFGRVLYLAGIAGLAASLALPWDLAAGRSGFELTAVLSRLAEGWGFTAGFSLLSLLPVAMAASIGLVIIAADRAALLVTAVTSLLVVALSAGLLIGLDGLGPGPWVSAASAFSWTLGAAIAVLAGPDPAELAGAANGSSAAVHDPAVETPVPVATPPL